MATTKRNNTLRVMRDDVIEVAPGKFLPKGNYPGSVSTIQVAMRGQTIDYLGRVMLSLTGAQIAGVLGVPPDPRKLGMEIDVAHAYKPGAIEEV